MITHRSIISLATCLLAALPLAAEVKAPVHPAGEVNSDAFSKQISALEKLHGGRLGVAAIDISTRRLLSHRPDERFAMCSTFKLLLAAAVAAKVDAGHWEWEWRVPYSAADLLEYAPVTGKPENVKAGFMTLSDLCAASVRLSDNTAANLLLNALHGPEALTRFLRSTGDKITRLDRNEPDLNTNLPDDPRDTSTPTAMLATMEKLLTGDALSPDSRERLTTWMVECSTGDKRLRAGIGAGWKVGDKTGTGPNGAANDVAIAWPKQDSAPVLIVVFFTGSTATPEERDAVIASVGRIVRETLAD